MSKQTTDKKELRFKFGENWLNFLTHINETSIAEAQKSLISMFETETLKGKSLVDVGSGSGLFSLAAIRLGAKVYSFDYDENSVECALELKSRYSISDIDWTIKQGSVLDEPFLKSLGKFDFVYSWGVLHHTGNMWKAIENTIDMVDNCGKSFIAIYNDQGTKSKRWRKIKKTYCSGYFGRIIVKMAYFPWFFLKVMLNETVKGRNPFTVFSRYKNNRGMSVFIDWVDWLGGYPFEVAKPEEIFSFFKARGFILDKLKTTQGLGCNEFVFSKNPA